MAYPNGFTYVSGPVTYRESTLSSGQTVRARNPVTLSDDRTVIEAASDTTVLWGIICHDAANSLAGRSGKVLIEIPEPETIYATKIQTGVAGSAISIGQGYGIEKSGNHLRMDPDSQVTPFVQVVGDQFGNTINSDDSSVFVRFYANRLLNSSDASITNFAQD